MTSIQAKYKTKKRIYHCLIIALFSILIMLSAMSPNGEHPISMFEFVMLVIVLTIIISIYVVLRCPNCKTSLVSAYSSSWGKLRFCRKCGVQLIEDRRADE